MYLAGISSLNQAGDAGRTTTTLERGQRTQKPEPDYTQPQRGEESESDSEPGAGSRPSAELRCRRITAGTERSNNHRARCAAGNTETTTAAAGSGREGSGGCELGGMN